jgi:hypothetical protein
VPQPLENEELAAGWHLSPTLSCEEMNVMEIHPHTMFPNKALFADEKVATRWVIGSVFPKSEELDVVTVPGLAAIRL